MTAQSFKTLVLTLCLLLCILLATAIWLATWSTNTNEKGTDLVGGAFELIDQDGNNVNESSFPNKFKLIYFGFTFCPDVCPIGLNAISEALDTLGTKAKKIKPLFITVDPLRDTVDVLEGEVVKFQSEGGVEKTKVNLAELSGRVDNFFSNIKSFEQLTILNEASSSYHLYVVKLKNTIIRRNFYLTIFLI